MKITQYNIPNRQEFSLRLFRALFPDMTEFTSYKLSKHFEELADLCFPDSPYDPLQHMSLNCFAWHLCEYDKAIFKIDSETLSQNMDSLYNFRTAVERYTDSYNNTFRFWLKNADGSFNQPFRMTLFFAWLLLNREECEESRISFYRYCMECLGITDEDGVLADASFSFDWEANGQTTHEMLVRHPSDTAQKSSLNSPSGQENNSSLTLPVRELADRDILGCGLAMFSIFKLIGKQDAENNVEIQEKVRQVQDIFRDLYKEEFQNTDDLLAAKAALAQAEKGFFANISIFDPRSLSGTLISRMDPTNLFVLQDFKNATGHLPSPAARIPGAAQSSRTMLVAGTGMGKSFYLQMLALCTLRERCSAVPDAGDAAKHSSTFTVGDENIVKAANHSPAFTAGNENTDEAVKNSITYTAGSENTDEAVKNFRTFTAGDEGTPENDRFGSAASGRDTAAGLLAKKIYGLDASDSGERKIPDDLFILSVPGRMFTFCYRKREYHAWTEDFLTLFVNCMWNFSDVFNFYSTSDPESRMPGVPLCQPGPSALQALPLYTRRLAESGRLLLLLDSFDEIPAGEMREAYFQALAAFRHTYCEIPGAVGAHIILSTREMSPETMQILYSELKIDPDTDLFRISPLDRRRRDRLVSNWCEQLGLDPGEKASMLSDLESNHYFREYASTPYMLSMVCARDDRYFSFITSEFVQELISRVENHYPRYIRSEEEQDSREIQAVLRNMRILLEDLALDTIGQTPPHLSQRTLEQHLIQVLDEAVIPGRRRALTQNDRLRILKKLYEILVTEVGAIVPAEGSDRDFQFINDIIRLDLAAEGLWHTRLRAAPDTCRAELRSFMNHPADYVGFLVPLLCKINQENIPLAESLVYDLTTCEPFAFQDPGDSRSCETVLVTAMLDLAIERYGSSILSFRNPGTGDVQHVYSAQRALIRRLLSSAQFFPTAEEKEALRSSAAFLHTKDVIAPTLTAVLDNTPRISLDNYNEHAMDNEYYIDKETKKER